ncbi:MAG: hypothetical protein ABFS23_11645 [Pseudomonadota bacterium]
MVFGDLERQRRWQLRQDRDEFATPQAARNRHRHTGGVSWIQHIQIQTDAEAVASAGKVSERRVHHGFQSPFPNLGVTEHANTQAAKKFRLRGLKTAGADTAQLIRQQSRLIVAHQREYSVVGARQSASQ